MEQLSSRNDPNSIALCLPKLSPAYYIISIIIFLVAPTILTIIVGCTEYCSCQDLLILIFVRLPIYFVCIYIFLPILAIFHNIQVILPCKLPKLSVTLPFDNWKLDKYSVDKELQKNASKSEELKLKQNGKKLSRQNRLKC